VAGYWDGAETMFDMEPVIESILSQLGAVADRRTLITSEKSESFAGRQAVC